MTMAATTAKTNGSNILTMMVTGKWEAATKFQKTGRAEAWRTSGDDTDKRRWGT